MLASTDATSCNSRFIAPEDLAPIVRASLSSHFFVALNQVWQQICGAGIGSQISLALRNLAVVLVERSWAATFQDIQAQLSTHFLWHRYAGNRFVVFNDNFYHQQCLQVLTHEHFYGYRVELESVDAGELLCQHFTSITI